MNALGHGSMGLLGRLRKDYSDMFNQYHELCGWFNDDKHQEEILGMFQGIRFPGSKNILCNAFTQRFFSDTKYGIDIDSWEKIIRKVIAQIKAHEKETGVKYEIHCPYRIGYGMKSDEIDDVKNMIEEYFADSDIEFVYHL